MQTTGSSFKRATTVSSNTPQTRFPRLCITSRPIPSTGQTTSAPSSQSAFLRNDPWNVKVYLKLQTPTKTLHPYHRQLLNAEKKIVRGYHSCLGLFPEIVCSTVPYAQTSHLRLSVVRNSPAEPLSSLHHPRRFRASHPCHYRKNLPRRNAV